MNEHFGSEWQSSVATPTELDPELCARVGGSSTILIVEDDPHLRALARRVLAGQAYRILEAANGLAALEIAASDRAIALVLTDVEMPTIGVRRMLRKLVELNPELRVLVMSGHTDHELLCRGFDKGSDAFLQKPFTGEPLRHANSR
jgi:two-component system cell cycle sensor histidine kinase/response regulator CckA